LNAVAVGKVIEPCVLPVSDCSRISVTKYLYGSKELKELEDSVICALSLIQIQLPTEQEAQLVLVSVSPVKELCGKARKHITMQVRKAGRGLNLNIRDETLGLIVLASVPRELRLKWLNYQTVYGRPTR
jgi:hypothetical protein